MSIPNTPIWTEFFEKFKELPELWKVKSEVFKDRNKKRNAWLKLLEIYQQIEPSANVDSLKKRVANIKTCYRRELKKVEQSLRSGTGADDEYVPNLWYFELLDFLRDQEVQIPGVSTVDLQQEEAQVEEEGSEHLPGSPASHSCSQKRKKTVAEHMAERNDLLKEALGHIAKKDSNNKDEASVYAESWATSFRKLSTTQQIYAKKAIEEILVLGQLHALTLHSVNTHCSENNSHASSTPGSSQVPSLQTSRSSTPFFNDSRASSTPGSSQVPSLQTTRSTTQLFQPGFSSQSYEHAVIIPGHDEAGIYSNVQQLLSDRDFS